MNKSSEDRRAASVPKGRGASELAHELRTRLAIVSLQLSSYDDPRLLPAEREIQDLAAIVDELAERLAN